MLKRRNTAAGTALPLLLAALLILPCATGCDFFRRVAGRPTSADIDARKELIREKLDEEESLRAAEQARLEAAGKARADSLAYDDSLRRAFPVVHTATRLGGTDSSFEGKYGIVIGAFRNYDYAMSLAAKVTSEVQVPVSVLQFRQGLAAVCLCPSYDPAEVYRTFKSMKDKDFFPPEAWLLINE